MITVKWNLRHYIFCFVFFDSFQWLTRYENLRTCINFTEAALIIMNAGQIYGRKVNFLASLVLDMERAQKKDEAEAATDKQKYVRAKQLAH